MLGQNLKDIITYIAEDDLKALVIRSLTWSSDVVDNNCFLTSYYILE